MARCGCAGSSCSCVIKGAGTVTVTGSGTTARPYVVDSRLYLAGGVAGNVDISLVGGGSIDDPYVINATVDVYLDDLQDVNTAGGSTGDVLALQSDGSYALVAPVTAPVGAISTDTSLDGDGSSGDPLGVAVAAGGGLTVTGTGLALTGIGGWQTYTPVITTSTGSILTLDPGSTIKGRYMQIGGVVFVNVSLVASLNIPIAEGHYSLSLPVPGRGSVNEPQLLQVQGHTGTTTYGLRAGTAVIEDNKIMRTRIDEGGYERNMGGSFPRWGSYAHRFVWHGFYEAT